MTGFLLYDLKVAVLMAVFYVFFRLLAAGETFHRLNRIVLLGSLALSLVLPLCVVTVHKTVEVASLQPVISVGEAVAGEVVEGDFRSGGAGRILFAVYVLGVAFCLARTLHRIYSVRRIIARSVEMPLPPYVHDKTGKTRLFVAEDSDIGPFSWMHSVVLSRKDYEEDLAAGSCGHSIILTHECGHIACRHSADMLFVDVIAALQWFNPVVWLLRKDLRTVHEYEADARVLSQGFNVYQYLNLLILKAAGDAGYSIANGISMSSALSKRVKMMIRKKSSRYGWAKLLYVVPIVAISLAATAKTVVDYKVKEGPVSEAPSVNPSADDEPLYVIDGNVSSKEEMMKLNPEDIESVTVLKEKSATEMWGSRGANGVVMILTKVPGKVADLYRGAVGDTIIDGGSVGALSVVEHLPQFPGGDMALMDFLANNVKYPEEAMKKGLQGRVVVNFIVEKDGSLTNVNVARAVDPLLDAEALRVVKAMPKWTPGKQNGKPVRVKFNIPVSFRLN